MSICQSNFRVFIADTVFLDSPDRRGREQLRQGLVIATYTFHCLPTTALSNSIVVILPDRQLQAGIELRLSAYCGHSIRSWWGCDNGCRVNDN